VAGPGLALQAYQTRALELVDEVAAIARRHGLRFMVRLVKGAYWDGEIKRAQEAGPAGLPGVHAQAPHRHVLPGLRAGAARHHDVIYPQFASHNAGTIAAIVQMARAAGAAFEMQRLHGMGEGIYREVLRTLRSPAASTRRWANTATCWPTWCAGCWRTAPTRPSCTSWPTKRWRAEALLASPLRRPSPVPAAAGGAVRPGAGATAMGVDLACLAMRAPLLAACAAHGACARRADGHADEVAAAMAACTPAWPLEPRPGGRARGLLRRAADALEARLPEFCALLVKEAHKTWATAWPRCARRWTSAATTRDQAERAWPTRPCPAPPAKATCCACMARRVRLHQPVELPAGHLCRPGGGRAGGRQHGGRPSRPSRRPAVAQRFVRLLHEAGVPAEARAAAARPGETVGAALVAAPAHGGRVLHRQHGRWRGSSTARWPPRTAPSCR
jgi:RHH-type proline utilization regulon transcriptional repressor/proline dehydrogenase/delta 1-pyrroline-5-carboxylate dehydrogenase